MYLYTGERECGLLLSIEVGEEERGFMIPNDKSIAACIGDRCEIKDMFFSVNKWNSCVMY